jgi:hypothetical protein
MADPWAEQAAFMGVVLERDGPKFLGLRLRIKNMQIREIESVVGRPGSSDPLPKDLETVMPKAIWQELLKPAEHVSREEMVIAANNYFEAIEKDAPGLVPWDESCTMGASREANGSRAPENSPIGSLKCDGIFGRGMMGGLSIPERHFWLIDEDQGIVLALSCSPETSLQRLSLAKHLRWAATCNDNRTPESLQRHSRSRAVGFMGSTP